MPRKIRFITEAGAPTVADEDAAGIERELLAGTGPLAARAHSAAQAIQAARLSDGRVRLEHAENLSVVHVLDRRGSLSDELAAFRAALSQAPSLTHELGREE